MGKMGVLFLLNNVLWCVFFFSFFIWNRMRLFQFVRQLSKNLEDILSGRPMKLDKLYEETLFSKIQFQLRRMEEIVREERKK